MSLSRYLPLIAATDPDADSPVPDEAESLIERLRPIVVKHGRMGTLSLATGALTVLRGVAALRSNKTRALRQLAVGTGWIAIGRAQRQAADEDEDLEVGDAWYEEAENEEENDSGAIADANQQEPRDFGDPGEGETPDAQTAAEPGEMTGPATGDAVPETDKEGGPEGMPADDVEMVDPEEEEEGELNEGSLQTDEEEEETGR